MLQARIRSPLVATLAVFFALSCGNTESRERGAPNQGGAGGARAGTGGQSGSEGPQAGRGGGDGDQGGADGDGGTDVGGEGGLAEAGASGEAGEAGIGGAPVDDEGCAEPTGLSILGDYVETNGDELWLRDSGKAVTLTRVPAGKPAAARLPSLWRVARACSAESFLVLEGAASFTRLDYIAGPRSLTVCLASETASSAEAATQLPAPDRMNTIDAGCNSGPWVRVMRGER
jgi:hypothetical protein